MNEIVFHDKQSALKVLDVLIEQDYVAMLSKEEELYIIDILYSQYSDRNDVVFMNREEFEFKYYEITPEQ